MRTLFRYRFMDITPAFAARQIFDNMNDALIILDPDGVIRLVNQATCNLFGRREQDLVGKSPADGTVGDSTFAQKLDAIVRSGTVQNPEMDYQPQEGAHHILNVAASIMRNPAGEPLATVCVVNDITERKRSEEEREKLISRLQSANLRLETMDKMKSDFVSVVSHELRTPLTTIKAFIELLIMKPGTPDQKRAKLMSTINDEADRLTRLISDLLDLARIEAGSVKWRSNEVAIDGIIRNAVANMRPLFENKGIHLTTAFHEPLPVFSGDRDRLVQVITNILSNAVKFTPTGGAVHIDVRLEAVPQAQIVVEITDTGIGIPAQDLESIFEKFHGSADGRTDAIEGTGLGLAIVRQIVEHYGGKIWAANAPGQGSTFTFTLPLAGKGAPAAPPQQQ
jgi:PAS domain S-box-containing protein